ncbi:MAG: hypothetical protein ACLR3C_10430 [Eggerthella lenta]
MTGTVTAEEEISQVVTFLTGLPLGQWYFDEASTGSSSWLSSSVSWVASESRFVKAFINGTADMMSVVLITPWLVLSPCLWARPVSTCGS